MSNSIQSPASALSRTEVQTTTVLRKERLLGVDVTRGLALLGMLAAHAFPTFGSDGTPTLATVVAGGRSAATFVLVAGVGLAFLSGGRVPVDGRERIGVAAGLVVRAVLIGALGLALGLLSDLNGVEGILPFYGLMFLLAIPLLWLAPLALAGVAAAAIALGPVLLVATADAGLPYAAAADDPVPADLLADPLGLLVRLCVTGEYPVVVYLAYLCAGLAIGRLDLTSRRVAWWLLGTGAALAVTARAVSAAVLYPLGGLALLVAESDPGGSGPADVTRTVLWEPEPSTSWWYLALPAPHSHSWVDAVHVLGSAMAVLAAALLLTRVPGAARLLRPLAVVGAMALTLYSAHLVLLATGVLQDRPVLLYLLMVAAALAFALLWRRWFGQGPLERVVATAAGSARRTVTRILADRPSALVVDGDVRPVRPNVTRGAAQLLWPLAVAAALALAFWTGALAASAEDDDDAALAADPSSEVAAAAPAPSPALPRADAATPPASADDAAGDVERYCTLSAQIDDLDARYPDQPETILRQAAPQLDELGRVAPVEIRAAVGVAIADIRAEGGTLAVAAPDGVVLERAETSINAFEDARC
jgi:uncharacterized membrane protein